MITEEFYVSVMAQFLNKSISKFYYETPSDNFFNFLPVSRDYWTIFFCLSLDVTDTGGFALRGI